MNSIHHGFWSYFFFRKAFRKRKSLIKWFIFGSIAPDLIYAFMFFVMGIQRGTLNLSIFIDLFKLPMFGFSPDRSDMALNQLHDLILAIFQHPIVEMLRYAGHSLFVWTVIFALITWRIGFKITPLTAFVWGWFGHIITDLLTHVTDATPIFYPVSDLIIRGPISYWHHDYFGQEFNIINNTLMVTAILYLIFAFIKNRKNKKRMTYFQLIRIKANIA